MIKLVPQVKMSECFTNIFLLFTAFCSDRLHKWYFLDIVGIKNHETIYVTSFFSWHLTYNTGISFGFLSEYSTYLYWIIVFFIVLLILGALYFALVANSLLTAAGFSFIMGGACSNLYDRFYFGAVVDLILLSYKDFSWYVFNFADTWIFIGCTFVIIDQLLIENKKV